jgi:hypothetical protein
MLGQDTNIWKWVAGVGATMCVHAKPCNAAPTPTLPPFKVPRTPRQPEAPMPEVMQTRAHKEHGTILPFINLAMCLPRRCAPAAAAFLLRNTSFLCVTGSMNGDTACQASAHTCAAMSELICQRLLSEPLDFMQRQAFKPCMRYRSPSKARKARWCARPGETAWQSADCPQPSSKPRQRHGKGSLIMPVYNPPS